MLLRIKTRTKIPLAHLRVWVPFPTAVRTVFDAIMEKTPLYLRVLPDKRPMHRTSNFIYVRISAEDFLGLGQNQESVVALYNFETSCGVGPAIRDIVIVEDPTIETLLNL